MHKVLKGAFCCICLLLALGGGYLLGTYQLGQREDHGEVRTEEREKLIAVVNLDEGIVKEESSVQYASSLLPYTGAAYTVTGIEDARNGVETGLYSAYVIIPASFSQTVDSINQQPAQSSLIYTISEKLNTKEREKAIAELQQIETGLNDSLTKMYVASLMEEFHQAQDASDTIMDNDILDKDVLEAVNAGDLVAMVEVPALTHVENDVEALDLAEQYAVNEELIGAIDGSYKASLNRGQEDLDASKAASGQIASELEQAGNSLSEDNTALGNLSISSGSSLTEDRKRYDKVLEDMQKAMEHYEDYLERYNQRAEQWTGLLGQYQSTVSQYQNALEETLVWDGAGNFYRIYSDQDVQAILGEVASRLAEEAGTGSLPAGYADWNAFVTSGVDRSAYSTDCPVIEAPTPGPEEAVEKVLTPGEKRNDETDEAVASEEEESVEEALDAGALIETTLADKEKLLTDFQEKKAGILGRYQDTQEAYQGTAGRHSQFHETLSAYDLASYIDAQEIEGFTRDLRANNKEVEGKVASHDAEYSRYAAEVTRAAGEDIVAMQDSVSDAQEESETLLENGLADAKASRAQNSETNQELLGDLAAKLPYTRLGDMENVELYEFVAAPLSLEKQEEEQAETSQADAGEKTGAHKEALRQSEKIVAVGILAAFVLILGGLVFMRIQEGKKEQKIEA